MFCSVKEMFSLGQGEAVKGFPGQRLHSRLKTSPRQGECGDKAGPVLCEPGLKEIERERALTMGDSCSANSSTGATAPLTGSYPRIRVRHSHQRA